MSSVGRAIEIALGEVADIADAAASALGANPASAVLHVTGIVLHGAEGVVHELNADDVEAIRQSQATGQAAGLAAYLASKSAGRKAP